MNADIFLALVALHLSDKHGLIFRGFGVVLCIRAFWHSAQLGVDWWSYAAVNNLLFALMPIALLTTRKKRMEIGH